MYRYTLLILALFVSLMAKAELAELTSSVRPSCTPCEIATNSKTKSKIMLRYKKHYNSWETESLTFYSNSKKNKVYSYNLEISMPKKKVSDKDPIFMIDLNGDKHQDLAIQVSEGARQSLYYYFVFDPQQFKYLPVTLTTDKSTMTALPLFSISKKTLSARQPAGVQSKMHYYQFEGHRLKLLKTK